MNRTEFTTVLSVALSAAALLSGQLRVDASQSPVRIPAGASELEALMQLQRATGRLVVAEKTQVDRRCETPIEHITTDEAILRVTSAYHLHAMVGRDRILFVRRFWDAREPLGLPVEEAASIVTSLHDLLDHVSPHLGATSRDTALEAFYNGLTPQQISAAQQGQLRLVDLSPKQGQAWAVIQGELLFGDQESDLGYLAALFDNWKSADFRWRYRDPDAADRVQDARTELLQLYWPWKNISRGTLLYSGYEGRDRPKVESNLPSRESAESLPASERPVTGCPAVAGPFRNPIGLADLAESIGAANGVTIQVPEWAKSRQFIVVAGNHSGNEVLEALAAVSGWVVRPIGPGRWALERPRVSPATDNVDYYRKERILAPPALRLLVPPRRAREAQFREARVATERWEIAQQVLKVDPHRSGAVVGTLESTAQRLLADYLLESSLIDLMGRDLAYEPLKAYITMPEQCHFRIKGDPDPNKFPMFLFEYRGQEPDGRVWEQSFGWLVNGQKAIAQ